MQMRALTFHSEDANHPSVPDKKFLIYGLLICFSARAASAAEHGR